MTTTLSDAEKLEQMQHNFKTSCFLLGKEMQLRGCSANDWATFQKVIGQVVQVSSVWSPVVSKMFLKNFNGLMNFSKVKRLENDIARAKEVRERITTNAANEDDYPDEIPDDDYSDEIPDYDYPDEIPDDDYSDEIPDYDC